MRMDYRYAISHDKFIVVDGETVEEGSFNYNVAAESKNSKSVLVLHNAAWLRSTARNVKRMK
jgi:phosphatidylserine/phosphatidylglycerophosphate/cardiolipin synthase-like enzyme